MKSTIHIDINHSSIISQHFPKVNAEAQHRLFVRHLRTKVKVIRGPASVRGRSHRPDFLASFLLVARFSIAKPRLQHGRVQWPPRRRGRNTTPLSSSGKGEMPPCFVACLSVTVAKSIDMQLGYTIRMSSLFRCARTKRWWLRTCRQHPELCYFFFALYKLPINRGLEKKTFSARLPVFTIDKSSVRAIIIEKRLLRTCAGPVVYMWYFFQFSRKFSCVNRMFVLRFCRPIGDDLDG